MELTQTWASVEKGYWYASFNQSPVVDTLRWLRVIGDTIFVFSFLVMGYFVVGLKTGWSITSERDMVGRNFLKL